MRAVGIDLGTTYSAVAVLGDGGTPEILKNREGDPITPSVVLFQTFDGQDEPLVGTMAKHSAGGDSAANVVDYVKRHMGESAWRYDSASGVSYSAEEVSAIILKRLKEDAEMALGEPVTHAVITVPAYFDDARRTATKQAGAIAGLEVMRVLNEPTAAALSYGLDAVTGGDGSSADGTVLVYDLGGGTFDVTVMRLHTGEFDVIATDGDRNLGGFNFDNRLMDHVMAEVVRQGGPDLADDEGALAMLREKAEMAKRSLTTVATATIHLSAGGSQYRVRIERAEFERITADLLNRTRDITETVLEDAHLRWADIDHVLLVGGSTRMPMVRELVEGLAGRPADRSVDPDQAVALGAAIQASMERLGGPGHDPQVGTGTAVVPFVVSDVTSHGMGVVVTDTATGREVNEVIIPRNSKIPVQLQTTARTVVDSQREVNVRVTQGDDEDLDYVVVVREETVAVPPHPKGSPLRITYSYDIDQTVFVQVHDGTDGALLATFEADSRTALDDAQLDAARTRVSDMAVS